MEAPDSFFEGSRLATRGLFDLLKSDRLAKSKAIVGIFKERRLPQGGLAELKGRELSREFLAGSILQLAYIAIERYAAPVQKSAGALLFESEIRRLHRENPDRSRLERDFVLPDKFCVGRDIGHLPLGVIIYAGRNQFCHYADERLSVVNELAFNHLAMIFPDPPLGLTFDTRNNKRPLSYSVLAAIGWLGADDGGFYPSYANDMRQMCGVEF